MEKKKYYAVFYVNPDSGYEHFRFITSKPEKYVGTDFTLKKVGIKLAKLLMNLQMRKRTAAELAYITPIRGATEQIRKLGIELKREKVEGEKYLRYWI